MSDAEQIASAASVDFGGRAIPIYRHRGRPCVLAVELGAALGYCMRGRGLVASIRAASTWGLTVGHDHDVVRDAELIEFRAANCSDLHVRSPFRGSGLTVLYQPGAHRVCALSTKRPDAKRLGVTLSVAMMREATRSVGVPQERRSTRCALIKTSTPPDAGTALEENKSMRHISQSKSAAIVAPEAKAAPFKISMEIIEVSPETAQAWLELNHPKNRRPGPARIARYVKIMKDGSWRLSHQGIAFDEDGWLVDGQHRLMAQVMTNVTLWMTVFRYGTAHAPLTTFDCGGARTPANALEMGGFLVKGNGKSAAAAAANLYRGLLNTTAGISRPEIIRIYQTHQEGIDFAVNEARDKRFRSPVQAALAYAYPVDRERFREFVGKVISGANLAENSPELLLSNLMKNPLCGSQAESMMAFFKVLRCLQAALEGEVLVKLQAPRGDDAAVPVCVRYFDHRRKALALPVGPFGTGSV